MDINKYSCKGRLKTDMISGMSNLDENDIYELLIKCKLYKSRSHAGEKDLFLAGKSIAVIHASPLPAQFAAIFSAVHESGGKVICFDANAFAANYRYLGFMLKSAGVAAAVFYKVDEEILNRAETCGLPFINAGNQTCSPLNSLAALYTLWELKKKLGGLKIVLPETGRSENLNSFVLGAIKCGCEIRLCRSGENNAIDGFVTERAMQYGEFSFLDSIQDLSDTDAVYCDFGAGCVAESVICSLLSAKKDAVLLCARPEEVGEKLSDTLFENDRTVMLQISNAVHVIKAVLNLII